MNAEQIISNKITSAFLLEVRPSNQWIEANPYIFEQLSAAEAINLMPAFMMFTLEHLRSNPGSMVYMQVLSTLNDYSKCKIENNQHLGFWALLTQKQKGAVLDFLGHLLHNQPANIDEHMLQKIITRWQ